MPDSAMTLRTQPADGKSYVGIFWLLDGKLIIDRTLIMDAEHYGEFRVHGPGHDSTWKRFQNNGIVPVDTEYDEVPRGRVAYNMKTRTFILLADRCILKQKDVIAKIKNDFRLPTDVKAEPDWHYRCPKCLVPWETSEIISSR